ncbi:hypothetical protein BROUX41_004325 [Berkeleyomyces rouxiae]|uniref:uncharacterized protein n=1 Tax=Berkeleyomyces rouxiae TaxID=2035830 RepID=UPI003B77D986
MSSYRKPAFSWAYVLRALDPAPGPAARTRSRAWSAPGHPPHARVQKRGHASFPRHGKAVQPPAAQQQQQQQSPAEADGAAKPADPTDETAEKPSAEPTPTLISEILGPPPPPKAAAATATGAAELPPIGGSRILSGLPNTPPFIPLGATPAGTSINLDSGSAPSPDDPNPPTAARDSPPPALDDQMQLIVHRHDDEAMQRDTARRRVHHFDSYQCVQKLRAGAYTGPQAVTLMKAIRSQLGTRLAAAQAALLSKSDLENEIYLFRAACSELGNEVKQTRRVADEQMRRERTHLQHELDILSQSLGQEISSMNDAVKGMVDDRSMSRREEHKARDSAIQQLNYKISIMLTSDVKADIETIRWILIRRAILGLVFIGAITLSLLRYSTLARRRRDHEAEELERQRRAAEAARLPPDLMQGHAPPVGGT